MISSINLEEGIKIIILLTRLFLPAVYVVALLVLAVDHALTFLQVELLDLGLLQGLDLEVKEQPQ